MNDKTRKKRESPPKGTPAGAGDNERPTVSPPFDVEAFARSASAPSRRIPQTPPPPSFDDEPRSAQVTITNELELEKARQQSAMRSEPPRALTPSILSIADARAQSSTTTPAAGTGAAPESIEAALLDAIDSSSGPEITERTIEDPLAEMHERFSLGDYTGALEISELILAEDPANLEAAECGENARSVLEGMFVARLGALDRVPIVVVPRTQMRWLSIDHRSGFILSLVDGSSTLEMILDVSGMPRLDALRILHELVQQRIVSFR